jgi:hypothetical protein
MQIIRKATKQRNDDDYILAETLNLSNTTSTKRKNVVETCLHISGGTSNTKDTTDYNPWRCTTEMVLYVEYQEYPKYFPEHHMSAAHSKCAGST